MMQGHPALRRLLKSGATEVVVFAETVARRWMRVTMPDGRRIVITVPKRV